MSNERDKEVQSDDDSTFGQRLATEYLRTVAPESASRLQESITRLAGLNGGRLPETEIERMTRKLPKFEVDTSPRETAQNTAEMTQAVKELVEATNLVANLTDANLKASKKADKRNLVTTTISLLLSFASAGAAVTSVILFLQANS